MFLSIGARKLSYTKTGHGPVSVLLLQGGPGLTKDYFSTIHQSLPENEFTVVSYNPSGTAGNETAPFYKSVAAFAREVKDVLDALNLKDVFLLGHSWGTAVVQEFLVLFPSENIKGIILANGFSSGRQVADSVRKRVLQLPAAFHEKYNKLAKEGDGGGIDALLGEYWFPSFFCRLPQLPEDIGKSLAGLQESAMYYYFIGSDLLNLNGALKSWDRTTELSKIKVPTLVMSGEFDYGSRDDFDQMVSMIPNAEAWYEMNVSHFPMYEKPDSFRNALLAFLRAHR